MMGVADPAWVGKSRFVERLDDERQSLLLQPWWPHGRESLDTIRLTFNCFSGEDLLNLLNRQCRQCAQFFRRAFVRRWTSIAKVAGVRQRKFQN